MWNQIRPVGKRRTIEAEMKFIATPERIMDAIATLAQKGDAESLEQIRALAQMDVGSVADKDGLLSKIIKG